MLDASLGSVQIRCSFVLCGCGSLGATASLEHKRLFHELERPVACLLCEISCGPARMLCSLQPITDLGMDLLLKLLPLKHTIGSCCTRYRCF